MQHKLGNSLRSQPVLLMGPGVKDTASTLNKCLYIRRLIWLAGVLMYCLGLGVWTLQGTDSKYLSWFSELVRGRMLHFGFIYWNSYYLLRTKVCTSAELANNTWTSSQRDAHVPLSVGRTPTIP